MKGIPAKPIRFSSSEDALSPVVKWIGLMGTPLDSGNRGVLALGSSLLRLCLEAAPNSQVVYFGPQRDCIQRVLRPNGRDYSLPVIHWRMSLFGGIRHHLAVILFFAILHHCFPFVGLRRFIERQIPWLGALHSVKFVGDVRGGDSFSDIYGIKRLMLATIPVISVLLVRRPFMLFPQTFGPYHSTISRWIARWTIRRATIVIARDEESQEIAQSLARPDQTVLLSPDVAFALHSDTIDSALFDFRTEPQQLPISPIGLNVNGLMYNGGYKGKDMFGLKLDYRLFLNRVVTQLLSVHQGQLILVPHTFAPLGDPESDNEACHLLKASLPPQFRARVLVVTGDYDAHQLKGIIGRCEFFVGSRMHSCIAALSQGVPCVGIAYSMKFRGVFGSVGMAHWVVDGRSVGAHDAVQEVVCRYRSRNEVRNQLNQNAAAARERLRAVFMTILAQA